MRVAIFDFDGTLYPKETFPVLMNHLKKHPKYHTKYKVFFLSILPRYIGYKLKLYPESKMKERSMQIYLSALNDLSEKELLQYFNEIANKMKSDFNPTVVSRFKKHMKENMYTMVVSGAYTMLLDAATDVLKFHQIIGTDIPLNNKKIDTSIPLYHLQGVRKNEKILEILKEEKIDWKNSFAYSDSFSDLPLLELVGNPVAVQPDERLKSIAKQRKWEII